MLGVLCSWGKTSKGAQGERTAFVSDNVVAGKLPTPFAHEALVALTTHQLHQHLILEGILQLKGSTGGHAGLYNTDKYFK